jgi:hypothetical protein
VHCSKRFSKQLPFTSWLGPRDNTCIVIAVLAHPTPVLSPRSGSVSGSASLPMKHAVYGIHVQNTQVHSVRVVYHNSGQHISSMDSNLPTSVAPASPPIWRWVLSFLAVGACWGLTTPFMRRAAVIRDQQPKQQRPYLTSDAPWAKRKIWSVLYAVMDLLRNPAYAVPLLLNVTGSVSPSITLSLSGA